MPDTTDHSCRETNIHLPQVPNVLLILGTDAAGKNYIADFIHQSLCDAGIAVEKREGWFSAPATGNVSSEKKSPFALLLEKMFLRIFPATKFFLPLLLTLLIKADLRRFRRQPGKLLVISHTGLRILAFYLGHIFRDQEAIRLPGHLDRALRAIPHVTGTQTIVLDISDHIRKKRIARRSRDGKIDNFDRYMADNEKRSERIEAYLLWLATKYLHAAIIENNDLSDEELAGAINLAFQKFSVPA